MALMWSQVLRLVVLVKLMVFHCKAPYMGSRAMTIITLGLRPMSFRSNLTIDWFMLNAGEGEVASTRAMQGRPGRVMGEAVMLRGRAATMMFCKMERTEEIF